MATSVAWSCVVVSSWWPPSESRSLIPSRRTRRCRPAQAGSELSESNAPPGRKTQFKHEHIYTTIFFQHCVNVSVSMVLLHLLVCSCRQPYLVVDTVEVGVETLMEPPAGVAYLGTDVASIWRAEALSVVVPTERILHRSTETRHMEAVVVLLILYPAGRETIISITNLLIYIYSSSTVSLSTCLSTWRCGTGRVCGRGSSPPGQCGGCSGHGWTAGGAVRCPASVLLVARQSRRGTPTNHGWSSLSHLAAAETPSSLHLLHTHRKCTWHVKILVYKYTHLGRDTNLQVMKHIRCTYM